MNTSLHRGAQRRSSNRGFTLVEIMVVITIILMLAGVVIFSIGNPLRRGRITSVIASADNVKSALASYVTEATSLSTFPLSEGTLPASMFTGTGATSANVAAAATLDQMLLTQGSIDNPLKITMGTRAATVSGVGVIWTVSTQKWTATAAPTQDKSAITRVECRVSDTTSAPSAAEGANFRLDGLNDITPNVRVAYLAIMSVPAEDAYQLSLSKDGTVMSESSNATADDRGSVVYAAPVAGVTDVYFYVSQL